MSVRNICPRTLTKWLARGDVRLIDVREADEFARTRIAGSESRPLSQFEVGAVPETDNSCTVVYCRSGRRSAAAATAIVEAGAVEVFNLDGGIVAWQGLGLPVVKNKSAPISLIRQVQIAIGTTVLTGTVLATVVSPWFLLLSSFAGAGLIVAGLTDTCAMAIAISKLPWNRSPACAEPAARFIQPGTELAAQSVGEGG